jgi:hypothetical protein
LCVRVCVRICSQEKLAPIAERICELDARPTSAHEIDLGSAAVDPWQVVADAQQVRALAPSRAVRCMVDRVGTVLCCRPQAGPCTHPN